MKIYYLKCTIENVPLNVPPKYTIENVLECTIENVPLNVLPKCTIENVLECTIEMYY